MDQLANELKKPPHLRVAAPSPWVRRFAPLVAEGGTVLDVTCGGGRHSRLFLQMGRSVVALDRNLDYVNDLHDHPAAELIGSDLEDGSPWPLSGRKFAGVVVIYYVHRPLFATLLESLQPGGVLICETFAQGDEVYHWPKNPEHLLGSGELLELVRGRLQVVAYEHGVLKSPFPDRPFPGIVQRICAVNDLTVRDGRGAVAPAHSLLPGSKD